MLPIAETYQKEVFKPMTETIKGIGKALGPRVSKKAIDLSKYQGVADNVQRSIPRVNDKLGTVTTPYGGSTKFERVHKAIDYTKGMGSPVTSFVKGKVSKVVTGKKQGDKAFGNFIIIVDDRGNRHRYSHLANKYVPFSVGQQVQRGDVIGLESNTGQTYSLHGGSGSHVDLRIRDAYGKFLNPMQFIR